jgi:hypothetical protein
VKDQVPGDISLSNRSFTPFRMTRQAHYSG